MADRNKDIWSTASNDNEVSDSDSEAIMSISEDDDESALDLAVDPDFVDPDVRPSKAKPLHLPKLSSHSDSNQILSSSTLLATFKALHQCCKTNDQCLKLYETSQGQGHYRCLKVECTKCKLDIFVDDDPHKEGVYFREHTHDNRRFAFAASCVGMDFNELSLLCSILNIPGPPDSFDSVHRDAIHKLMEEQITEKLNENRRLSKETHAKDNSDDLVSISVKTDGTYQKRGDRSRGYTSKVGVVLITHAVTDRALDFEVLTKHCHTCNHYNSKLSKGMISKEEFDSWYAGHEEECNKNFEGASSEMERHAVKAMFHRSTEYGLRYEHLVGDGDSKSFLDVWDIYGVCDLCRKHSSILTKRSSKEFEEWKKSEEYAEWVRKHNEEEGHVCHAVKKIDCIQHVAKCFRSKLEDIAKAGKKASDGGSRNRGTNRLGPNARVKLQKYFGSAIRKNIRPGVISAREMDEAVVAMRRAIMASLYHCTMLEDDELRHQFCPADSWCMYKRRLPMEDEGKEKKKTHHLAPCFLEELLPVYEYYTQTPMLQRLVAGMTTNSLESFNSTLWHILPKSKFNGRTRVETAVMLAIVCFEDGKQGLIPVMEKLHIPATNTLYFQQADKSRSKRKEARKREADQRFISRLKDANDRVKDLELKSYSPGVMDAAAGPTAEMQSTAFTSTSTKSKEQYSKNQFVAISYGPIWYPCRIEEFHAASNEIYIEVMYTRNDYKTFYFKKEGEPGYEGLFWETTLKILCRLPQPLVVGGDRGATFPSSVIDMVQEELQNVRKNNRKPRK